VKVVDVMTPNPHWVTADQPLLAAAFLMREHDIGFVPVIDDRLSRKPVGVITDHDIAVGAQPLLDVLESKAEPAGLER
jgi:CBS domain-containing protein